ncbi:MAG: hypothetical protein QF645_10010 [Planctomycetota bacterium]|nr:hypothetical protein [Planctomycetota bacterium]
MKKIAEKRFRKYTPHITIALAGILCMVSLLRGPERSIGQQPRVRLNHPEEFWVGQFLTEIDLIHSPEQISAREPLPLGEDPVPALFAAINGNDYSRYLTLLRAMRANPTASLRWILPYFQNAPGDAEATFLGALAERLATLAVFSPSGKILFMEELGSSLQGNISPVVTEALAALLATVNDGSRTPLLKNLIRKNPSLASRVFAASARKGEGAGFTLVLDVVDDSRFSTDLRSEATAALVQSTGTRSTERLFDLAHSSQDVLTRMLAVSGLASLDRTLAESLESPALLAEILHQIQIDPKEGPSSLRGTGIVALAALSSPEARSQFRVLLSDSFDQDSSWAITVAAALGSRDMVPVLFNRVDDSEGRTRSKLIEAISYMEMRDPQLDPVQRERLQGWVDREVAASWPNPSSLSFRAALYLKKGSEQTVFLTSLLRETDSPSVANFAMSELKTANPEAFRKVLGERIRMSGEESPMGRWARAVEELRAS